MTAEEIRAGVITNVDALQPGLVLQSRHGLTSTDAIALLLYAIAGEIAAQLAEQKQKLERIASALEGLERKQ